MKELSGKVAVVTGGASGIGRSLADSFAADGMKVVLADVDEEGLEAAAAQLRALGAQAVGVRADVAVATDVEHLKDAALQAFGGVHVVCNNAGVGAGGPMWEVPLESWQWVLGVNLWGVIHGVHTFTPLLVEQGEGHIVNTASSAGVTSVPLIGPYATTKHAVVGLSESLALDLAGTGVGVSALCPMWVRTRILESSRNAPPEVLAAEEARGSPLPDQMAALAAIVESGLDPAFVAQQVIEAVKTDRFYVLPHPAVKAAAVERARRIAQDEPPSAAPLFG